MIGLVLGSLIDCLAMRSLTKESFWGRSYCDSCKTTLRWYDLFPIISYFLLRGRCRDCHKKISLEAPLVELISGIVCALIVQTSLPVLGIPDISLLLGLVFKLYVFCILSIFILTDLKSGLIPDRISLPSILVAAVFPLLIALLQIWQIYSGLQGTQFGRLLLAPGEDYFFRHAVVTLTPLIYGYIATIGIGVFFGSLILFTRGRGMGGGDLKLGIFIGLALGYPSSVMAILLSFVLGSIAGVGLILFRKKKFGQTIPFGPFLSFGSIVALLWGPQLIDWYFRLKIF